MSKILALFKKLIIKILAVFVEGRLFRTVFNLICRFIKIIGKLFKYVDIAIGLVFRKLLMWLVPIDNNRVMFLCFQGDYCCNPKGIVYEMQKRDVSYKIFWRVKKRYKKKQYPKRLRLVRKGTFNYYKALASSKVIVDNTLNLQREHLRKKKGQYLIQTWHGSLGIKKLNGDVVMNRKWKRNAKLCSMDTDFCITNSSWESDVFDKSYWNGVTMLEYGHARNDILFTKDEERLELVRTRINNSFNITSSTKIFLYAPTHRDNENEHMAEIDFEALHEALVNKFGGEWVILVRLHSRLKSKSKRWLADTPDFVIDATRYPDMQELLLFTDVGLTDFSSWIFDYMLLNKPGFILFDDLSYFEQSRGFYYPLETTPFPIAKTNEELINNIRNFDEQKYKEECVQFLDEKGCIEDGHASERIVDKITELLAE